MMPAAAPSTDPSATAACSATSGTARHEPTVPFDSNLSMLTCISADGGTLRLTAQASFNCLAGLEGTRAVALTAPDTYLQQSLDATLDLLPGRLPGEQGVRERAGPSSLVQPPVRTLLEDAGESLITVELCASERSGLGLRSHPWDFRGARWHAARGLLVRRG